MSMGGESDITPGRVRLVPAVVAGCYSWALTVLPAIAVAGGVSLTGAFGFLALLSLLAAPFLPPGRWSMVAALDVFVGGCVIAWWGARDAQASLPFGVFGTFGWLAYTLALGALSTPLQVTESDPGPVLHPRTPPSRLAAATLLAVFLSSLLLLGAAWRIERPAVAVLAHVLALGAALITLRAGAHLAVYFQVRDTRLGARLLFKRALPALILLSLLVAAGLYWSRSA